MYGYELFGIRYSWSEYKVAKDDPMAIYDAEAALYGSWQDKLWPCERGGFTRQWGPWYQIDEQGPYIEQLGYGSTVTWYDIEFDSVTIFDSRVGQNGYCMKHHVGFMTRIGDNMFVFQD